MVFKNVKHWKSFDLKSYLKFTTVLQNSSLFVILMSWIFHYFSIPNVPTKHYSISFLLNLSQHYSYIHMYTLKQCLLHNISPLCSRESSWGQRAEKEVLSDTRYFNLRLKGGLLSYSLGYLKHNSLPKFSLAFHILLIQIQVMTYFHE